MDVAKEIVKAIDKHYADTQGDSFRMHLGASVLGEACARQVWYGFRWARSVKHTGRLIRLFNRGHDEEPRIVKWLNHAGLRVYTFDPSTNKQYRFKDETGHVGGSGDGIIEPYDGMYPQLDGNGLFEAKTHGDKSFKQLVSKGVISSKPTHFVQMQIYMKAFGLKWALYCAVNKNDDHLHFEIVHYKEEVAQHYLDRAKEIVGARFSPPRINESASWWMCRFCDFKDICHNGKEPDKNCRSCVYAEAIEDGQWRCLKFNGILPPTFLRTGCDEWEPIE